MRRTGLLRAIAVVGIVLPGLVLAAPTPGGCGHCDRGAPCLDEAAPASPPAGHSCCGAGDGEHSPAKSTPSKACGCGHEAPPAVTVQGPPSEGQSPTPSAPVAAAASVAATRAAPTAPERPPAPPPSPPIYLVDCVFLT